MGAWAGPDPLRPSRSHPRPPRCGGRGGLPLPSHPCRISLYRTIFKMEAKTQYTLDRHAHTCTRAPAPQRGRTSAALREHHGMHTGPCLGPHGPQLLPTHCPASCQGRAVQGWGERAVSASRCPRAGGRAGEDPGLRYLRGKNAWALPLEKRQGPRVGSGAGPTALACQPGLNTHLVNLGARRAWTPSQPHSWEPGLPLDPPHSGARPGLGRRGEQGLP